MRDTLHLSSQLYPTQILRHMGHKYSRKSQAQNLVQNFNMLIKNTNSPLFFELEITIITVSNK